MNLIILGTDHALQNSDVGLKERTTTLIKTELIVLIGEEYTPNSVSHQVADSKGIKWIPIDMTPEERNDAGIAALSRRRFQYRADHLIPEEIGIYAPNADGVREQFWLTKLEHEKAEGTILLICGAVHVRPLSEKAQDRGHKVTALFFPESLSGLRILLMAS